MKPQIARCWKSIAAAVLTCTATLIAPVCGADSDSAAFPLGSLGGRALQTPGSSLLKVTAVTSGGPAASAGLQVGDFIHGVNGNPLSALSTSVDNGWIGAVSELGYAIERAEAGSGVVSLGVLRPGTGAVTLNATVPANTAWRPSYPTGDPRADSHFTKACADLHTKIQASSNGDFGYNTGWFGMSLLASPNWNDTSGTKPYRNSINKLRDRCISHLNGRMLEPVESGQPGYVDPGLENWDIAASCMFLGEYRRKTGDTGVNADIQRCALMLANRIQHYAQYDQGGVLRNKPGLMGHGGVSGDYPHIGLSGINIINSHTLLAMAILKGAGADFSAIAGSSGLTINQKFQLNWSWLKGCTDTGGGIDDGNVGYAWGQSGWDSAGRTAGSAAGYQIYLNAGGTPPASDDQDKLSRMKAYCARHWQRQQHCHAYSAGGVASSQALMPFLADREQRYFMENSRFLYTLSRDHGGAIQYFPGRGNNGGDEYLAIDNAQYYLAGLTQAMVSGNLPSFPAPSANRAFVRMNSPLNDWPQLVSRRAKVVGLVQPLNVDVTNHLGTTLTSGYTTTWSQVSGSAVSFSTTTSEDSTVTFPAAGNYRLRLIATVGTYTVTEDYDFEVAASTPPPVANAITTQPLSRIGVPGGSATFSVAVSGTGPFLYEWKFNGVAYWGGSANPTLSLPNLATSHAGDYTCSVHTPTGTLTSATATLTMETSTALTDGGLKREIWNSLSGGTVASLTGNSRYPMFPDVTSVATSIETPSDYGDNYGERYSGWILPPTTGQYKFFVTADDTSEVWLSTTDSPTNKVKICEVTGWKSFRAYSTGGQSAFINLTAGQRYYIEVLHKEASSGDQMSLAWQLPGGSAPANGSEPIGSAYLQYQAANVAPEFDGLVSWWKMDEGTGAIASDTMGTSNDGTVTGASWGGGVRGGALVFDGNDKVTCGSKGALSGVTPLSLVAWVKVDNGSNQEAVVIQQRSSQGTNGQYQLKVTSTGRIGFHLYGDNATQFDFTGATAINDGKWHRIAATRDASGNATIYLDNVVDGSVTGTTMRGLDGSIGIGIGADTRDANKYFRGSIDDVRVYSRELSPAEIAALGNQAPVFTNSNIAGNSGTFGSAYSGTLANSATDTDAGETLVYSKVSGPAWLIVTANGTLSGYPDSGSFGTNQFLVRVADNAGSFAIATLTIEVAGSTNLPPSFTTSPITGTAGAAYTGYAGTLAGTATDGNAGDSINYSKTSGPAWLVVAADGSLSGIPGAGDIGSNSFTVRAADNGGLYDVATLNITVNAPPTWINASGGSWMAAGNWQGGVPSGSGIFADFSTLNLTADRTVTLDSLQTIGTLKFGDSIPSHNWTLDTGSGGPLTLATSTGTPFIDVVNQTATISAALAGSQGLIKSGAGTLVLSGTNTYDGITTVNQGMLKLGSASALGSTNSGTVIVSGATLDVAGQNLSTVAEAITVSGTGIGGTTGAIINSSASKGYLRSTTLAGDTTVTPTSGKLMLGSTNDQNATLGLAGYTLTKNGSGTLILNGVIMSGAGNINVTAGTLQIFDDYSGGSQKNITLAGIGNLTIQAGAAIRITRWGAALNMTMPIVLNGGNFGSGWPGPNGAVVASPITLATTSTLDFGGPITLSGVISGPGTLIRNGSDTTILTAANTYTGPTVIDSGALMVNGSLSNGPVTVNNSGTLGGVGTLGGAVTVATGGKLVPGSGGIGTLTVNNTLSLAGTAQMEIAKTGAVRTSDKVSGVSTLTYAGTLTVTHLGPDAPTLGDSFQLFNATTYSGSFASFSLPTLTSGQRWSTEKLTIDGTIKVVAVAEVPVATNDSMTIDEDATGTFAVLANDSDGDGGTLAIKSVSQGTHGTVAIAGTQVTFTPQANWNGTDSFTYTITDNDDGNATATVNVTVNAVNDTPAFTSDPVTGARAVKDVAYSGTLVGSATDADAGATLNYAKVSGPTWLNVAANGTLSGTPAGSDLGDNAFTVSVTDSLNATDTATLNITVIEIAWTNPAGGSWSVASNWLANAIGGGIGATIRFDTLNLITDRTVTLDGARTVGGLAFSDTTPSNNWTLNTGTGGSLTLSVASGNPVISVANPTTTIGAVLAGNQGLVKSGSGTLVLRGTNSYTGATNVSAGTLQLGDGMTQPTINSTYDIAPASTLRIHYNTTNGSSGQTWSKYTGAGALALETGKNNDSGWGTAALGSSFTGTLQIEGGRVAATSAVGGGLGGTSGIIVKGGAQLGLWNGGTLSQNLTIEGSGYGEGNGFDVALRFADGGQTNTLNGNITLTGDTTIGARGTGIATLTGMISETTPSSLTFGTLNSSGSAVLNGTVVITGANTYTGNTTITAGTLEIGGSGSLGNGNYSGNIANAGTLRHASSSAQTLSGVISGTGALTKSGTATLILGGANTYTGTTAINGGSLLVNGSLATTASTTVAAAGTLGGSGTLAGAVTNNGTIAPGNSSVGNLTVNNTVTMPVGSKVAWEIADWTGAAGTGWDKLTVTSLIITATNANRITIRPVDLALAHFSEVNTTFTLVQTSGGITGFAADKFTVDTSGLTLPQGTWAVQQSGNNLVLAYTRSNTAPVFTNDPIAGKNGAEGAAYSGTLAGTATDSNIGEALTYAKVSGPAWLTVTNNGALGGTPVVGDIGANSFSVRVTDSMGATDTAVLNITVVDVNVAPVFTGGLGPVPAAAGYAINGQLTTSDADPGDTRTITKRNGPTWLSITGNGALSGTPSVSDVGVNTFTVRVTDAAGLFTEATLTVNVTKDPYWTNPAGGSWPVTGNWLGGMVANGNTVTGDFSELDLAADATVTLDGARTIGGLVFGDLAPSHNWTLNTGSGGVLTLDAPTGMPQIAVNNQTATLNAVLAGSKGLLKSGGGTLYLTPANTYSGGTTITGGILKIGNNSSLGSGTVTVNTGATLDLNGKSVGAITLAAGSLDNSSTAADAGVGDLTLSGGGALNNIGTRWFALNGSSISGSGDLTIAGKYYANANATLSNTGSLVLSSGVLDTYGRITFNNGGVIVNGGNLNLNGTQSITSLSGSGGTVTLGGTVTINQTTNGSYAGKITGSSPLIKSGSATLTLTGTTSNNSGTTTVSGGSLLVNGSLGNTATTIGASGTLGGNGSIAGSVSNGGTLAPGNGAVGNLTIDNTLTLTGDSKLIWEINNWTGAAGTGWDKATVTSLDLTATSANRITIRPADLALANFTETNATFVLIQTTTGITGFGADKFTVDTSGLAVPRGTWAVQQSNDSKTVLLAYTANPDTNGNGISDSWESTQFGNVNAGANRPGDDADNDGLTNLMEYAIGTNPMSNNAGPVVDLEPIAATKYLRITVNKNPQATNLTYIVETCSALNDWTTADTLIETNTSNQLVVRDTVPMSSAQRRFVRLKVITPP